MNGSDRFATDLAKVCLCACAKSRTVGRAALCPPQTPYRFASATLALFAILLLGGCSREEPQPLSPPEAPVVRRMEDSAYVKQLNDLRAEQSAIAERAGAIQKELEAARAEDPESAKTKELEKKHAAVLVEMEAHRAKALVAVRNRMLQDEADAKANNKKGNK